MQSFLDDLIDFLEKSGGKKNYHNLVIVLPSQRAGVFLKNKLCEFHKGETLLLPEIISIESFIEQLSGISQIENTELILLFYEAYLSVHPEEEKRSFENFLSWGQTLLQDFNEIDRYLVDQERFFKYLYYINDQKHWFLQEQKTELIQNYIQFWERMHQYYNALVAKMNVLGKGHQGHQYRTAAENIVEFSKNTTNNFVFAGFNALNNAEQTIIKTLIGAQKASVFWDADTCFLNDKDHDASLFLKRFKKELKVANGFEYSEHTSFQQTKKISITGTPKNVGQAKYVTHILEQLQPEEISKTALVLADENLLLPILNSIPPNITNVNITMGLSLSYTPIMVFFNQFFSAKENIRSNEFYGKDVLALLQNNYVKVLLGAEVATELFNLIVSNNLVYVSLETLKKSTKRSHSLLEIIFAKFESVGKLTIQIEKIINELFVHFEVQKVMLQTTYFQKLEEEFISLTTQIENSAYITSLKVYKQLFFEKLSATNIDFRGEPTAGLQIMGVLESRCLDFENIILCSVNEGTLPSGKSNNSFIPFDLKIDSGLPTYKEKDAIYAYHFYRLLQRAKNIHLIYNTEVDNLNSGEKSRFIQQLELEPQPNHVTESNVVSAKISAPAEEIIEVHKNEAIISKLKSLAAYGFSPSAFGVYLRNPMKFYEQYVLGVRDSDEIEEQVAANTLGTVIHNVLENFYKPLENKWLHLDHLQQMKANVNEEIEKEFKKVYSTAQITHGINYITFEAATHYLQLFLDSEMDLLQKGHEIEIVAIESNFKTELSLDNFDFPIFIKGKVDRVDKFDGVLRVIDYKTGQVKPADLAIKDWNLLVESDKYAKALQLLMYAYMYCNESKIETPLQAGIIGFKSLKQGLLRFSVNKDFNITTAVFEAFKGQVAQLISELFDINQAFIKNDEPTYYS